MKRDSAELCTRREKRLHSNSEVFRGLESARRALLCCGRGFVLKYADAMKLANVAL